MVDNEFTGATNAQYATAGNWALGHKPTATERAVIPATKACECKTAVEAGALKVRGKLTVTSAGNFTFPLSEAAPENAVIDLVGAESVTWNAEGGGIILGGAIATAQTIALGTSSVSRISIKLASTGNFKATSAMTLTKAVGGSFVHEGKGTFEFNGQTVTAKQVECREGSKADFTNATFKCSGEGGVFMLSPTGTTFTGLGSCTVEVTDRAGGELAAAKQVNGAGKEIGTIVVTGFNVTLESLTWGTLKVENGGVGGAAAGAGCKLKASASFTGTSVTANGTEANPARLESSTAATAAKLKLPEQELAAGFLAIKDIAIETGVWYVPAAHGSNVSGNSIVKPAEGFTLAFEAKPGGGIALSGSASMKMGAAGTAKAAAALTGSSTMRMVSSASAKASAAPAGSAAMRMAAAGVVRAAVSAAGSAPFVASSSATARAAAAPSGSTAMRMAATATLTAGSSAAISLTGTAGMRMTATATLTVGGGAIAPGPVRPGQASAVVRGRPAGAGAGAVEGRERIAPGRAGGSRVVVVGPRGGVVS